MKIQEQDHFHGTALMQVVEYAPFKAINKVDTHYGHYLVNTDRHLFIKYTKRRQSPWTFVLTLDELKNLKATTDQYEKVTVCLVCGNATICAIRRDELLAVVDVGASTQQWIKVTVPPGSSCRVSGSLAKLTKTVPHNSFPSKVFE